RRCLGQHLEFNTQPAAESAGLIAGQAGAAGAAPTDDRPQGQHFGGTMARAADGSGYFLYHSIGQFPDKARLTAQALAQFCDLWGRADDAQWQQALQLRQQFIEHWCRLIHAPAGTLTGAENVTAALYSLIGSLPERHRGRRVLIAADCFPSLHFLLSGMAQRHGFVLDTVPLRPGEHWVRDEDVLARWGDDVAVALLTMVTSTASHRCDLSTLIQHGHRQGSVVGV